MHKREFIINIAIRESRIKIPQLLENVHVVQLTNDHPHMPENKP